MTRRCLSSPASVSSVKAAKAPLVQSLDLDQKIEKIPVTGSLITSISIRRLDKSVFRFPEVISGADEYMHLVKQRRNIRDHFARILIESREELAENGFQDLWKLSLTETVSIYESMGESRYQTDALTLTSSADVRKDPLLSREFNSNVIRLMIRNHLVMPLIRAADNEELQRRLLADCSSQKIAFAYTEKHAALGSMLPADWTAEAKMKDPNTWLVSGKKSYILDDDYDQYIIFCKTSSYVSESIEKEKDKPVGMNNNGIAITAFVVPKERLDSIEVFEEAGIKYQCIRFPNLMLTTENMLLTPSESGVKVNDIKATAQLVLSSFLLGRMKSAAQSCGRHMDAGNESTFSWDYMHQLLVKIYALESAIYYTAGLVDSYEGRDVTAESMLVKVIANESSHEAVDIVQRIVGAGHPVAGPMHDMLEMYDSFMDCPLHCKMITAMHAFRMWGQYKNDHFHKKKLSLFYVRYWFVDWYNRREDYDNESKLIFELDKILNPVFKKEAKLLEHMIVRMEYLIDDLIVCFEQDVCKAQMQAARMGELSGNILTVIAVLTRACRAIERGLPAHEREEELAREIVRRTSARSKELDTEVRAGPFANFDNDRIRMHRRNLYYNGYFPFSPLDKNMY